MLISQSIFGSWGLSAITGTGSPVVPTCRFQAQRLGITLFAFLLCWLVTPRATHGAFSPTDNCLWISPGNGVRNADGSVTLPLSIRYGRFPAGVGDLTSLRDLRVRYALASGDSWSLGEIGLEPARDRGVLRLRVGAEQRLLLRVNATSREKGRTVHHHALTWYQRAGRSGNGSPVSAPPGDPLHNELELSIAPRFHYWRQVGESLGIGISNRLSPASPTLVTILDEHLPVQRILVDPRQTTTWTPPDDHDLNSREERSGKETLLVAESDGSSTIFRTTTTLLLHRNRTGHHRLAPGLLTLGCSCGLTVLAVTVKRRKTA